MLSARTCLVRAFCCWIVGWGVGCWETNDLGPASTRVHAEEPTSAASHGPADFRSKHFLLHTDLPPAEAEALLKRLEQTLGVISSYWNRPPRGTIECFIVRDLNQWQDTQFNHPLARIFVAGVGGATVHRTELVGKRSRLKVAVFASGEPGIAEHEAVHAYCAQTFGATPPDWYNEGMAELAYYRHEGERGVACPEQLLADLRGRPPKPLHAVIRGSNFTAPMISLFQDMHQTANNRPNPQDSVPLDTWTSANARMVVDAKHEYLWSWAVCHMMCHNPNYAKRFRALGQGFLSGQPGTFDQTFGAVQHELEFEFRHFVTNIERGYRVDLCHWDWGKKFRRLDTDENLCAKVDAARGYQPSSMLVTGGQKYVYEASGDWRIGGDQLCTAAGNVDGAGQLEGVIFKDFQLSEPFALGEQGSFIAPTDGKLFLRCRDAWGRLADNQGTIRVKLRPATDNH